MTNSSSSRWRVAAIVALLVVIATAAACSSGDDKPSGTGASSGDATVTIDTFDFQPDPLVVAPGTTVRFANRDAIAHTVTAGTRERPAPAVFDETLPDEGASVEITLEEPGTYDYFCRFHPGPGMTATMTVE